jgi:serine/threonine-protein kinase
MIGRVFLGRYQAVRLLGEGGMGQVYLARQLDLGRQVVVKVMHDHLAADPKFCERFQRETLVMARFQHPYAVTLYDASLNDPQGPCIVMEFIRGVTLDGLLQGNAGRLSPGRVSRLLGQLCEVLQAAHTEGIIHRDLKPANLMVVDPDTPYEKIKVMDFGLAKLMDRVGPVQGNVTGTEFAVGTPTYISPEQVRGETLDHRSDLYSVGVILYEMLAGRIPFGVKSTMDLLLAHATEDPLPFTREPGATVVSPALEAVVMACLAKDPADRPASARELAERYEAALVEGELPPQDEAAPPPEDDPSPAGGAPDPEFGAAVFHLEAWMPEAIAVHKLRGFMHDAGGEVLESVPGVVRVQLGGPGSSYDLQRGRLSWFGRGSSGLLEMILRMRPADPERANLLSIRVAMRALDGTPPHDPRWQAHTAQIFCDLRGYLMGHTDEVRAGS